MEIAITSTLLERLLAEAAAAPEHEICGLLCGTDTAIADAVATANVAPDPARHFEVDPRALFAAIRAERDGGPQLIGHYHSHPNGSTVPSARDAADAEPGRLWLILADGRARLWRSGIAGFEPVALRVRH